MPLPQIVITDVGGRSLYRATTSEATHQVSHHRFRPGFYIVSVAQGKRISYKKLVVR